MSAHHLAQRNIRHTPAVDRMMRKRSHLSIIDKRQRTADDDDDPTTTRGRTVAASARTTATTAAARVTAAADDDNTRTTARAAATTTASRAPASSSAPASRTTAARGASSNAVNPNLASTGASGSLGAGNTASASASAGAKSSTNNTGMIVGVIVVCLAVLAAMAAFVILRRKRRAQAIAKGGAATRAQKGKSEDMFGNVGPQDMAAVDSYRNRMESDYGPNGAPIGAGAGAGAGAAAGAMAGNKVGNGFNQAPYSPNDKSRRSWDMSDDGRSFGNHSEVGLVGAAAYPGQQSSKGRQGSGNHGDGTYGSEPYSPQHAPPVPAIDPALAAIQAVGVNQNAAPAGKDGDGQIYVVKRMFEPSLSDELIIYPGDRVRIVTLYDDGWCLTENLTSASPNQAPPRGVCPRDCIDNAPLSEAELASSPISAAGGANRISMPMPHPSLPPLQIDNRAPQIEVSSPTMSPHDGPGGAYGGMQEGRTRQLMSPGQGQQGQGQGQNGDDGRPKRHSSLIASRDAELFMALGEVLEKDQGRK